MHLVYLVQEIVVSCRGLFWAAGSLMFFGWQHSAALSSVEPVEPVEPCPGQTWPGNFAKIKHSEQNFAPMPMIDLNSLNISQHLHGSRPNMHRNAPDCTKMIYVDILCTWSIARYSKLVPEQSLRQRLFVGTPFGVENMVKSEDSTILGSLQIVKDFLLHGYYSMFPQSHRSWGWRIVRKLEPFSVVSSKQSSFRAHLPSMVSRACFSGCSLIQGWGLFDQNTTWSNYQCWKHHGKGSYTGPKHLCWKHLNQTLFCLLRLLVHEFDPPDHAWPPTASDAQAQEIWFWGTHSITSITCKFPFPRQSVENFERSLEDHYSVITDPWTCRTQFDTKHNTDYHTGWLHLQWDHEPRVTSAVEQSSKAGQTKRWHMSTTADTCWHISALLLVVVKPVQSHAKNATQNHMEPLCSSRSSL